MEDVITMSAWVEKLDEKEDMTRTVRPSHCHHSPTAHCTLTEPEPVWLPVVRLLPPASSDWLLSVRGWGRTMLVTSTESPPSPLSPLSNYNILYVL